MISRRQARQRALQILYQWDMRRLPPAEAIAAYYATLAAGEGEPAPEHDPFVEELVTGTAEGAAEIDRRIASISEHWRLERMPVVDRNVLRLAIFELMKGETPPAVVIDEALELARRFSSEESVAFVNGVLDAVRRELKAVAG